MSVSLPGGGETLFGFGGGGAVGLADGGLNPVEMIFGFGQASLGKLSLMPPVCRNVLDKGLFDPGQDDR